MGGGESREIPTPHSCIHDATVSSGQEQFGWLSFSASIKPFIALEKKIFLNFYRLGGETVGSDGSFYIPASLRSVRQVDIVPWVGNKGRKASIFNLLLAITGVLSTFHQQIILIVSFLLPGARTVKKKIAFSTTHGVGAPGPVSD